MSFEFNHTLRYIFSGYFLGYSVLMGLYGLIIDSRKIKQNEGANQRDEKVSRFLYISCIVLGIVTFAIPRLF